MLMVFSVGVVAFALMLFTYKVALRTQDNQRMVQVRVDASQRESALLRSILAIVPNRAIQAMRENSAVAPTACQWQTIFADALDLANADDADGDGVGAAMGAARVANSANFTGAVSSIFAAASGTGLVYPGVNTQPGADYPPYLVASGGVSTADAVYPIITWEKTYGANAAGTAQLSTTQYPLYNKIPYPNIRFGYGEPGSSFVAKRNWWAFSIRYPSNVPGVPALRKQYLLSLYEVPTQLALTSSTFMSLGRHQNGSAWNGVQINGSVFGERILAEESLSVNRMSSRTGIEINAAPTVGGTTVQDGFDSNDTVQQFEANQTNPNTFFPVSVAAGAGRVAFVPLNRGLDFYKFIGSTNDPSRLSPTGWDDYSVGARRCAVQVRVIKAVSTADQTPLEITVTYKTGAGTGSVTLVRGTNWPYDSDAGGTLIPFQSEVTDTGRRCLAVHVDRLNAWLNARGGSSVAVNNAIAINVDPSGSDIRTPSFPSNDADLGVTVRGGSDLTAFTTGFSLVTNLRLFYADDLNQVSTTVPAGSGLSGTFFPPVSIFAPEQRWGTSIQARNVQFRGQIGGMSGGASGSMVRPLDLKSGQDNAVATSIDAVLSEVTSPAQLPPITFPNWLLTIEEVNSASAGVN